MNFFEIMKYFARAIEQMRAVDGILIPQFPWPYCKCLMHKNVLKCMCYVHNIL